MRLGSAWKLAALPLLFTAGEIGCAHGTESTDSAETDGAAGGPSKEAPVTQAIEEFRVCTDNELGPLGFDKPKFEVAPGAAPQTTSVTATYFSPFLSLKIQAEFNANGNVGAWKATPSNAYHLQTGGQEDQFQSKVMLAVSGCLHPSL
jgi:hypothetical protein